MMYFVVGYRMDEVGYSEEVEAKNEEEAKAVVEKRLKEVYPNSNAVVETVTKIEKEKVEKKKTVKE
jgi:hypothetical protein